MDLHCHEGLCPYSSVLPSKVDHCYHEESCPHSGVLSSIFNRRCRLATKESVHTTNDSGVLLSNDSTSELRYHPHEEAPAYPYVQRYHSILRPLLQQQCANIGDFPKLMVGVRPMGSAPRSVSFLLRVCCSNSSTTTALSSRERTGINLWTPPECLFSSSCGPVATTAARQQHSVLKSGNMVTRARQSTTIRRIGVGLLKKLRSDPITIRKTTANTIPRRQT